METSLWRMMERLRWLVLFQTATLPFCAQLHGADVEASAGRGLISDAPESVSIAWTFEAGDRLLSSPAVDGDRVYAGADNGRFVALETATGAAAWTFQAPAAIRCEPAITDELAIFQTVAGTIHGVRLDSGEQAWRFRTGGETSTDVWDYFVSSPLVVGDAVYIGSGDGHVYKLGLDGEQQWKTDTGGPVHAKPASVDGRILVGNAKGRFVCLDAATGEQLWDFQAKGEPIYFPDGALLYEAAVVGEHVVFGSRDYHFYTLRVEDGELVSRLPHPGGWTTTVAAHNGDLYGCVSDQPMFYRFEAGKESAEASVALTANVFGTPAFAGDLAFIGGLDGRLHAIQVPEMKRVWSFRTQGSLENPDLFKPEGGFTDAVYRTWRTMDDVVQTYLDTLKAGATVGGPATVETADGTLIFVPSADGTLYAIRVPRVE